MQSVRPWVSAYAPGVAADITIPTYSLSEPLYAAADRFGDQVALDFLGKTTTYRELVDQVRRAAQALLDAGVRPGDRVGIALPNCPQHVVAFYAAQRIGAIAVEINPTFTRDEIAHELTDSAPRLVVCWQRLLDTMAQAAKHTKVETIWSADLASDLPAKLRLALKAPVAKARRMRGQLQGPARRGFTDFARLVATTGPLPADHPFPDAEDTAALLYTSGTTGRPRAAMLSHRNLAAVSEMGEAWVTGLRPGGEVFVAALPFFHSFGMQLCLLFGIRMGAHIHVLPSFDAGQVLDAHRRKAITFFPGVPAMFERVTRAAKQRAERGKPLDMTTIAVGISGAMALPTEVASAWEELTGGYLIEGYGMTETAPIVLGNPIGPNRRPGWAGLPFPSTEIRLGDRNDPEREAPAGEAGELLVRGPQVTKGYWNRPQETAAAQLADGWWRTGDIAEVDESGFVKIVDRTKEIIITGGFNVYPSQVEDLVRAMPQVEDVAIVGLPAEGAMGERVVAAVVLAAGAARLDLQQVREWCEQRLAKHAWPREIVLLDELPRSQIGKVLRRVVRDQLLNKGPRSLVR